MRFFNVLNIASAIFKTWIGAPNKALKRDSCRVAFWFAVIFVVKVGCGKLVYAAFTP